jgi:hypothetical protein
MPVKSLKGGIGVRPLGFGLGVAEEAVDPNFNQTVLLLHADGSEGEGDTSNLGNPNYKAFRDNSTSAHAIVVNGDAYGNDFSPYYYADGYWSNFFDGTDDHVKPTSTSSDFNLGTGQFTFEAFIYTFITTQQTVMIASGATDFNIYINGGKLYMYFGSNIINGVGTINVNQWHHIVVQRDSSDYLTAYVDGTRVYYTTQTTDYTANNMITIGEHTNGTNDFNGYISNVRFVASTAVYSGASITVPTTPLTAITNTKLLTCQSNRFVDNSTSSHALTIGGDPAVSTNTPFTQSKTANVGSGFFDGTGDGLTTATSSDFAFGTNNFTFECWVYPFSDSGTQVILDLRDANNNDQDHMSALVWTGSALDCYSGANFSSGTDLGNYFFANSWNHIAVQRSGDNLYHSVNGIVSSTNPSFTRNLTANGLATIGGNVGLGASMFSGYIADMRIVNGTAVYGTSNFSVPTAPLTAVTNTKLLTCQYEGAVRNVGFLDDSKYNTRFVRAGDVSMGTFSPFSLEDGYWSVYFDGSDDELNLTNTATIGTGNFTMEMWVFPHNRSNSCLIDSRSANGATDGIIFKLNSSKFQISGNDGTTNIPLDEWTHLAVVREGTGTNETKMYVNGALEKTITFNLNLTSTFFGVGVFNDGGNSGDYKGYISNLRVVNDTVYTGAFTVSSEPLTAISNTDVLICQSNRFIDNSTNGFAITLPQGTAKVLPFSPFAPSRSYTKDAVGGSAYFDGTGDSLTSDGENNELHQFGTGDFTAECWYYCTKDSLTDQLILSVRESTGGADEWALEYFSTANQLEIHSGTTPTVLSATNVYPHQWVHAAFTRESGTSRLFVNGELRDTDTGSLTFNAGHRFGIGNEINFTGPSPFLGHITNVRITKGTAVYTSAFTPPTAPLSEITNSTHLLNFANAGIIDHTMKNNLESRNNTRISGQQIKFGTGSIYFDGTGDDLRNQEVDNPLFFMGTSDWTLECFAYSTGNQGSDVFGATLLYIGGAGSNNAIWLTQNSSDKLCGRILYNGSSWTLQLTSTASISHNTWYHVAFELYNGTAKVFINGTSEASGSFTADLNSTYGGRLSIGSRNATDRFFNGYLDEIRISRVGRYQGSNFTAPTKAFANK